MLHQVLSGLSGIASDEPSSGMPHQAGNRGFRYASLQLSKAEGPPEVV